MDRRLLMSAGACLALWSAGCSPDKPAAPAMTGPPKQADAPAGTDAFQPAPKKPSTAADGPDNKQAGSKAGAGKVKHVGKSVITASGLEIEDVKVGTGATPHTGQRVFVDYIGTLSDGTQFDSSFNRTEPFSFVLGMGEVIKGWDEGVATMRVGGKRILVVPPQLGYGPQNMGKIPPNSTLTFIISLHDIGTPENKNPE